MIPKRNDESILSENSTTSDSLWLSTFKGWNSSEKRSKDEKLKKHHRAAVYLQKDMFCSWHVFELLQVCVSVIGFEKLH